MSPPFYHPIHSPRGLAPARFRLWVCGVIVALALGGPARAALAVPRLETDGSAIAVTPPAGAQLAYSLNGVDPRGPFGLLGLSARVTDQPLVVGADALLAVRAYLPATSGVAAQWSELATAADAVRVPPGTANPLLASRLRNLSALVRTGLRATAPITGFVVRAGAPRTILVRAVGPALAQFGVADAAPDPVFILRNARGCEVARVAGWAADPALPQLSAGAGAFPLPDASADSACAVTLPPGAYTMQLCSAGEQPGTALAEIYDLERGDGIAGLSTRATLDASQRTLVSGFIVQGSTPKKLLVRAVGPGLAALGVDAPLANPTLSLWAGLTRLAQNDDWAAAAAEIAAAGEACGAFRLPAGSQDAALLVTLAPGAYTAQATAKAHATGTVLLEIYAVP